jgi:predicted signal transduction protein with EAL and GGDEF domain
MMSSRCGLRWRRTFQGARRIFNPNDEFTVLAENIDGAADVTRLVERIQAVLKTSVELAGQIVFVTASMGIALYGPAYEAPGELLRDADAAVYRAKALGKARYAIFDEQMHAHAVNVLQVETQLRTAVTRCEFVLHYQPVVELPTARVVGFEALLRVCSGALFLRTFGGGTRDRSDRRVAQ